LGNSLLQPQSCFPAAGFSNLYFLSSSVILNRIQGVSSVYVRDPCTCLQHPEAHLSWQCDPWKCDPWTFPSNTLLKHALFLKVFSKLLLLLRGFLLYSLVN
jgi:hypothetical protein